MTVSLQRINKGHDTGFPFQDRDWCALVCPHNDAEAFVLDLVKRMQLAVWVLVAYRGHALDWCSVGKAGADGACV